MAGHKHIDIICVCVTMIAIVITVLFINGKAFGLVPVKDEDAEAYEGTTHFTANDYDGSWDTASATTIMLDGDQVEIDGPGAFAYDGGVYIQNGGHYIVKGTLTDGSILVDAYNSSKIWILLDGVNINRTDDSAIIINQADKVFLTLARDSVNTIKSGASFREEAVSDGRNAALFSRDDLTINGRGSLTVLSEYRHGITSKDDLVITGGKLSITAAQDAIHVNDSYRMTAADLTLEAGDDAIHSDKEIYIADGTLLINDCYEGLEALTIEMDGGDVTIYPRDDGLNANGGGDTFGKMGGERPGGNPNMRPGEAPPSMEETTAGEAPPSMEETTAAESEDKRKTDQTGTAAKAEDDQKADEETWIKINGGNLLIVNETGQDADGIDSNGDIYINGGTIRVSMTDNGMNNAIDFGSESGGVCKVNGGTIIAAGSSSMVELFDSGSTQPSALYIYSQGADPGTLFTVTDTSGKEILSWEIPCSYSSVAFSSSDMTAGETFHIAIGDQKEEDITLEEMSASYGDALEQGLGHKMDKTSDRNPDRQNGFDHSRMQEMAQEETEEETDVSKLIIDIDRSSRITLVCSLIAILAGLAVSAGYKRRRK